MTNIVERLRRVYLETPKHVVILYNLDACREAADEFERLREDLTTETNMREDQDRRLEKAETEIKRLREAIEYAHSQGFEWPSDPMPKDKADD